LHKILLMKSLSFIAILVLFFSCGEDKHKKDTEENTYFSKYKEIYNSYDSLGVDKTLASLDEYISEFPNAQNAYFFKAWIYAENNQLEKIDDVFNKAIQYDSTNVSLYYYWASFLLKDSNRLTQAKNINQNGLAIENKNLELLNNSTWILMFDEKYDMAFQNAENVLVLDTNHSSKFYRTALISSIALESDSSVEFKKEATIKLTKEDLLLMEEFKNKNITLYNLYNQL